MTVTNYLWSEDSYLEEYAETGEQITSYTNEPAAFGSLISQHKDNQTSYFQFDSQGSTRQLTDSIENITDSFLYDAWGNEIARTGTSDVYFRYIGEEGYYYDTEVDSYYVRSRSYSPITSNWLSVDPIKYSIAFSGLISSYHYVSNSPLNGYDFTGLKELTFRLPGPCPTIPQTQEPHTSRRTVFRFHQFGSKVKTVLQAAKKQKNKIVGFEMWKLGFIQQVKIDISYFGGVSIGDFCCTNNSGVNCTCKTCAMDYHFDFIETLHAGDPGDRHPTTSQSEVLGLLGKYCPECRKRNQCCASGYKLTITKTVSPALVRHGRVHIQRKSANVSCAGSTVSTPIIRADDIPKPPSFPDIKAVNDATQVFDFFGIRFPQKRAVYGVEFKHPKCKGATKRVFGWEPEYKPYNYWPES
ncbi:RHS repeat domain-containing protein [Gimesia chilikensis]|uniref:RHS repeat domain-containing protein n=1 Tax=Gimesia chilikensis TaxID=2605989 RepID=UPI003A9464CA